ncbi:uncharacterized protein F5891DRAFT_1181864 [Suillus fuscotomentosus]|uniref:Uncharacterized protein n=1 Tax=Suillus fuscotomentosus TaxID=1912939 RepID=A0AAD4EHX1_9AGAM|nr:uncharacterized protein F5891DRAFT_1181864 [Suillus fuscotomentosus]KAG1906455.1 hypothetical protein F5891DRAFT_1181864 [Suillus fuscotomentosus]
MGWINDSRDDVPPRSSGWADLVLVTASTETRDRHKKAFSTIARDLADHHPEMRRALAHAVKNQIALKTTPDIIQQCHAEAFRVTRGARRDRYRRTGRKWVARQWRHVVTFFAFFPSPPARFATFRIQVVERDICTYVSEKLEGLRIFGSKELTALAQKDDGLFEWARLACKYIEAPPLGSSSVQFFNVIVSRDGVERGHLILKQIIPKDRYRPQVSANTVSDVSFRNGTNSWHTSYDDHTFVLDG